ncbi:MAG: phospholipase, partial [bacterium]
MPVSSAGPFWKEIKDSKGYNFLLFLPANDAEAINGKYPTILFLHGIGESGSDLQLLKRGGFPKNLEGDRTFPFIFIMPQCPSNTEWYYENV